MRYLYTADVADGRPLSTIILREDGSADPPGVMSSCDPADMHKARAPGAPGACKSASCDSSRESDQARTAGINDFMDVDAED